MLPTKANGIANSRSEVRKSRADHMVPSIADLKQNNTVVTVGYKASLILI